MTNAPRFTSAVAALLCAACGTVTEPQAEPQPTLRDDAAMIGPIVARDVRTASSGGLPTMHVRRSGEECGVIFAIPEGTPVQRKTSQGTFVDVPLENLAKGVTVAVWTNVVLRSCPGQASAHAIEVF